LKYFISLIFVSATLQINAQFLEFGGGVGGFNYSGDLIRGYQITNIKPGFTIYNRLNFSNHVSLRTAFSYGKLSGSDKKPIDSFAMERGVSFSINLAELSSVFEYHFLDYKHRKAIVRWSPYVFMGIGFLKMSNTGEPTQDFNTLQPAIPFGLGFKHLVGRRFSAGFEFGVRKTFFDYLDNISDADLALKNYQYGNPNDNDWYTYVGVTFSYIIFKIPCPFPYVPNEWRVNR
jgi:hypothetical protein